MPIYRIGLSSSIPEELDITADGESEALRQWAAKHLYIEVVAPAHEVYSLRVLARSWGRRGDVWDVIEDDGPVFLAPDSVDEMIVLDGVNRYERWLRSHREDDDGELLRAWKRDLDEAYVDEQVHADLERERL